MRTRTLILLATCLAAASATAQDTDGDGVLDADDNCRSVQNGPARGNQADANADGVGDACQCGDANGDGFVDALDARVAQRCAVGLFECPALCDATGDGACNGLDAREIQRASIGLVSTLALTCRERPAARPRAAFASPRSVAVEGESVRIEIALDEAYAGGVRLRLSGTASDADVAIAGCAVDTERRCGLSAAGRVLDLSVEIFDDVDPPGAFEELEWLSIEIEPDAGYDVAATRQHVLTIRNNDGVWDGLVSTGGEQVHFALEIQTSAAGMQATLVGDGLGLVPAGRTNPEAFELDASRGAFRLLLPALPLGDPAGVLPAEAWLTLDLLASDATGLVASDRVEAALDADSGSLAHFDYPDAPHLQHSVPVGFALVPRPSAPSSADLAFEVTP